MLTIVGDVIEYDGKPFAVITMPLSGVRIEAVKAIKRLGESRRFEMRRYLKEEKKANK